MSAGIVTLSILAIVGMMLLGGLVLTIVLLANPKTRAAGIALLVIGLVVFGLATSALSPVSRWLASQPFFMPPEFVPPVVDPRIATLPTEIMGVSLKGNWLVLAIYALALVFNILGEELYMRGYILPRQVLTHGRWAWLVHGILWKQDRSHHAEGRDHRLEE